MEDVKHPSLAAAKLAIMSDVSYVQKKMSKGLNYSFAREADIVGKFHEAMVRHRVVVAPVKARPIKLVRYTSRSNATMRLAIVRYTYRFTHADSGQHEDVEVIGEGADAGDKACNKSMTAAYKYLFRQSFVLETGDDPDETPSETLAAAPKRRSPVEVAHELLDKAESVAAVMKLRDRVANSDRFSTDDRAMFEAAVAIKIAKLKGDGK